MSLHDPFDIDGRRRRLLQWSAGAALYGALPRAALSDIAAHDDTLPRLARTGAFLTGRAALPADYVASVCRALQAHDPRFDEHLRVLDTALATAPPNDVQNVVAQMRSQSPELHAAALAIVEAFYTGTVGRGSGARMVGYETALMFEATADVTVIPSYVRARPEYWTARPADPTHPLNAQAKEAIR
ncbi:sugar dehydrogenase complex small subunit [Burkholderia stabilis]|uniref:sugar dehydrogenase complex small subunit n=1 Tax=Burkholderia stabilis TaxID=95485 RepID=UPI00159002EE|nr:sugar dehydrogenase complex small subunit [Burkholderia stabilis]